jgi:leucyl aminopeptidase
MIPKTKILQRQSGGRDSLWLIHKNELNRLPLEKEEIRYIQTCYRRDDKHIHLFNRLGRLTLVVLFKEDRDPYRKLELARLSGDRARAALLEYGVKEVQLICPQAGKDLALAFAEGMVLGSYRFLRYKTGKQAEDKALQSIFLRAPELASEEIAAYDLLWQAVSWARDLVNEPLSGLTAEMLAKEVSTRLQQSGASAEVFNRKRIQSLKMGGLLAVNQGSVDPPTFTTIEWKPDGAVNAQPVVLVGKGVVYDTGGLSLKPSNYMDTMKSDMAGAAAVAAATLAVVQNRLPLHIITLIPATDNRPDGNAYVPGDVVTMFDGSTVEVLNTDAEGRMILADALAYAKKFKPALVIDVATLTGSAQRATGKHAMVGMQVNAAKWMKTLQWAGEQCGERLVEFPMYEEYAEMLKSDIADVKNIGGAEAGAITAAKFLERFTDYPYIHLDIAGTAFAEKRFNYRGTGGTGSAARLIYSFLKTGFLEKYPGK